MIRDWVLIHSLRKFRSYLLGRPSLVSLSICCWPMRRPETTNHKISETISRDNQPWYDCHWQLKRWFTETGAEVRFSLVWSSSLHLLNSSYCLLSNKLRDECDSGVLLFSFGCDISLWFWSVLWSIALCFRVVSFPGCGLEYRFWWVGLDLLVSFPSVCSVLLYVVWILQLGGLF